MLFLVGFVVVVGSVLGGYVLHHGKLEVLWQPTEFLIIGGAAIGSFLIGNPMKVVTGSLKSLKFLLKGAPYNKTHYVELLTMLYEVLKLIRSKGMLELESHIENPKESSIFSKYKRISSNHHVMDFICDYLRIMTMGVDDHYQMEELMDKDLEAHHNEVHKYSDALMTMGDGMPALGIVAAVLGVIVTMGSISEPPEILGGLIGAALVGTFLGVLMSYGFVSPMGRFVAAYYEAEADYVGCIKNALLAHMKGNAPAISVEFARNTIPHKERPSFIEVEEACQNIG